MAAAPHHVMILGLLAVWLLAFMPQFALKADISWDLLLNRIVFGPVDPIPRAYVRNIITRTNLGGREGDDQSQSPIVTVFSNRLGKNLTIAQSHMVLSPVCQVDVLNKLAQLIDVGRVAVAQSDRDKVAKETHNQYFRAGVLYELSSDDESIVLSAGNDADVAIIRIGKVDRLGFGWRYPLEFWSKHGDSLGLKCCVNHEIGQFYYC